MSSNRLATPHRVAVPLLCATAVLFMASCSKPAPAPAGAAPAVADKASPAAPPATSDHGSRREVGKLAVSGWEYAITVVGTLAGGKESAIEAKAITSPAGRDWQGVAAYVWIEDAAGNPLTAPSKPVIENGQLHFHASVPAGAAQAANVVLRIRENGVDERVKLAVAAQGTAPDGAGTAPKHAHEKTPHDGVITAWKTSGTPAITGFAEVKLHDDKGDVEVWLGKDRAFKEPFVLPAASRLTLTLVDLEGRKVTLAPRDLAENKDEGGVAQLVAGQTGYFIFPGETGEDATALKGKTFSSLATLSFHTGNGPAMSEDFVLVPHTHAPGQEH